MISRVSEKWDMPVQSTRSFWRNMKFNKLSREHLTAIFLIGAACGMLAMFLSLWPEHFVAREPNKMILAVEIVMSVFFLLFGLYSWYKEIKKSLLERDYSGHQRRVQKP